MRPRARPRRWAVIATVGLWIGLILPGLTPLLCPFPPFQDWPAHVGVVGALGHMDDPATRLDVFYVYTGWFKLNMLFYLPAWGLTAFVNPVTAANVCLAVAVGSLGPAVWLLCRSLDADPRMALLATPLALGRHVYCGFGPNAAALPLFAVALAAFFFCRRASRSDGRAWVGWAVVLVAAMTALAFMHAFIWLAAAGLLGLLAAGDAPFRPRGAALAAGLALVASGALFAVLFASGLGVDGQASEGATSAIWRAILQAPRDRLVDTFWAWLFASYRYRSLDDLCQVIWAVGLLGAGLTTVALEGPDFVRTGRAALLGLAAVTAVMFVVLPENVGPPVNWWGARLRLPVMGALLVVPLVRRDVGRQLGAFVPAVGLAAVVTVGLATVDLAAFHRTYTAGLSTVLEAMPPGLRVQSMHYTPRAVNEYPGQPFGYFGNFYLAARGGAVPQDFFERKELPFRRRARLASPPWGMASGFRWPQHARGFDGFLVRSGSATDDRPFFRRAEALELEASAGGWRFYRMVDPP